MRVACEAACWAPVLCRDWFCLVDWVDHWQTLVGAALALPLAFWAIRVPARQEHRRQERRRAAVRASMPIRLSELSDYSILAMRRLAKLRRPGGVPNSAFKNFEKPQIPQGLVQGLESTIEALEDERVVGRLSSIIGEIQVLDSNMAELHLKPEAGGNIDSFLRRAALIHAQTESLYEFARGETEVIKHPLDWGDVRRGLQIARVYENTHPDVYGLIERRECQGKAPEAADARITLRSALRERAYTLKQWAASRIRPRV